jgi:hypothetical protein
MRKLSLGAVLVAMALPVSAQAGIIIGTANSDNCIPWSCRSVGIGNYEQIYNSSAFTGTVNIGDIEFFNTFFNNGVSQGIANMSFSIYLDTSAQSVPDGSIPGGAQLFGSFSLNDGPWTFGQTLTFTGTPFLYDPSNGNLELVVEINAGSTDPGSGVFTFFDAESGGPFSRWCGGCGTVGNSGFGLVTGFSASTSVSVPEPTTLALFGAGLLGLSTIRRRRKMKA